MWISPCPASLYARARGDPSLSSAERTASAPYTRENGISPVGFIAVVRIDHSTVGSSSIHFLPCFLSLLKLLVLRPLRT